MSRIPASRNCPPSSPRRLHTDRVAMAQLGTLSAPYMAASRRIGITCQPSPSPWQCVNAMPQGHGLKASHQTGPLSCKPLFHSLAVPHQTLIAGTRIVWDSQTFCQLHHFPAPCLPARVDEEVVEQQFMGVCHPTFVPVEIGGRESWYLDVRRSEEISHPPHLVVASQVPHTAQRIYLEPLSV